MYRSIAIMLFLLMMISGAPTWAQEQQAWVGHQFHPEQCVKIEPGKFPYKRKLGTIVYDIVWTNGLYTVNGTLLFDARFVPDKVKSVDLEVLLIGQDFVCKKQIDISKEATSANHFFFGCGEISRLQLYPHLLRH